MFTLNQKTYKILHLRTSSPGSTGQVPLGSLLATQLCWSMEYEWKTGCVLMLKFIIKIHSTFDENPGSPSKIFFNVAGRCRDSVAEYCFIKCSLCSTSALRFFTLFLPQASTQPSCPPRARENLVLGPRAACSIDFWMLRYWMGFKGAPSSALQYHLIMIYAIPRSSGKASSKNSHPASPSNQNKRRLERWPRLHLKRFISMIRCKFLPKPDLPGLTLYVPIRSCEAFFWIPETARERKCNSKCPSLLALSILRVSKML